MMQDILGLDSYARLNMPGRSVDNWKYMFKSEDFSTSIAKKLARYKEKYAK